MVSLSLSGNRVTGVNYEKDGQRYTAAGAEVVLTAGAFHSPHIMMLSGIGPAAELRKHGIEVLHDRPGVGENYQDHAMLHMGFRGTRRLRGGLGGAAVPVDHQERPVTGDRRFPRLHAALPPCWRAWAVR